MSEQVFNLPDLGEGLTEADVLTWHVAVGDEVTVDQIVVEVETAKAAVEVPIPFAGTVVALHGQPGATLAVGKPLITVSGGGVHETYRTEERAGTKAPEEKSGSGNVLIGYGTKDDGGSRRRRRKAAPQPALVAAVPAPQTQLAPRVINPLVRGLAKQHGIDLATLVPSGPAGIVLRKDVEAAIAASEAVAVPMPEAGGRNACRCAGSGGRWRTSSAAAAPRSRTPPPGSTPTPPA